MIGLQVPKQAPLRGLSATLSVLTGLFFLATSQFLQAQDTIYEIEPNDTPAEATVVKGAFTALGSLSGTDQDGFKWVVSDVDAAQRWTLELKGIPGRLTIVQIFRVNYSENGIDVAGAEKLFTIGSRDGTRPGLAEDLLFEPGEYILGVAHSGDHQTFRPPADSISFGETNETPERDEESGSYRLVVRKGSHLIVRPKGVENDSKGSAINASPGTEFASFSSARDSWYRIGITDALASNYWDFEGQVPVGRTGNIYLKNADDEQLAETIINDLGKFSFRDLSLESGEYFVEAKTNAEETIQLFRSASIGQKIEGREAEPNDRWDLANRFEAGALIEGRLVEGRDTDFFRFEADEQVADQVSILQLETGNGQQAELCLLGGKGRRIQCRAGTGKAELPDLVLAPGVWGVSVTRGKDTDYTLTLRSQGEITPGREMEPNDTIESASSVPAKNRIIGSLSGNDRDYYRIVIDGEAQLWFFQASGEGLGSLAFFDGAGVQTQNIVAAPGQRRIRMDNVFLVPGEHYLAVSGQDGGEYTLLARSKGQPDPDGEFEPNDDTSRMQPLRMGQTRTGLLEDKSDKDLYRFNLANWDRIRITILPPPDGRIQANAYWSGISFRSAPSPPAGEKIVMEGLFQPGDFHLALYAIEPSDEKYSVSLERLERFGCPVDCEPNDSPAFANPLPADLIIRGSVGEWNDSDWYELPALQTETELRVRQTERHHVTVSLDAHGQSLLKWDDSEQLYRGLLPPGVPTYLNIRAGRNPKYRLELEFAGGPEAVSEARAIPVSLDLQLEAQEVSAYRPYGQLLSGKISFLNSGSELLNLYLEAASSDRRWRTVLARDSVSIPPGGSHSVPVDVQVPHDAWAGRPVRVSVAAYAIDGGHIETFQEIRVEREIPSVNPHRYWEIPEELLGGFNVAQQNFGSRWLGEPDTRIGAWFLTIFDGVAIDGLGLGLRGGYQGPRAEVPFEFAGNEPVEVAGLAINLLSHSSPLKYLRKLDFWASTDGTNYRQVFNRKLDPVKSEQVFVLDTPVMARFGKLIIGDDFTGVRHSPTTLGEIKVITRPGYDLSRGQGFNLASPDLGGHVVWANPRISLSLDREILTEDKERIAVSLKQGQPLEWVVGFHHNRAARIRKLDWLNPPNPSGFGMFSSAIVSVSLDSPIGPWQPLGEWSLQDSQEPQSWELAQPAWARFVKFSAQLPSTGGTVLPPDTLRIWEEPVAGDYMSILGEWGDAGQAAIYEALQDLQAEQPFLPADNDSRERAFDLQMDQLVAGTAWLEENDNWYRLAMPDGHNTLTMALGGESSVRTVIHLEDESGNAIPVRKIRGKSTPSLHIFEAVVPAGNLVYLKVEEPPRNVAFMWDTSPSVAPFVPIIYNAMLSYAGDLVPGRDAANFVPYGRNFLLRDWYGQPFILQTVLNDYPRGESSSAAEMTMETASRALAERAGTKAIINVTDAATGRHVPAWEQFAEVQPRIFNLGVSSAGNLGRNPYAEQDLMQDWSRVNGGHYQYMLSQGEMEVAFDRAATLLRRPADYTLRAGSEFREAPGPGTLAVVAAKLSSAIAGSGSVELILDASGSMLKRLDGKRRIEIAKEVLIEAVNDLIPAGTPLALRVFGHKDPNACRTDLEIPLAPLNPESTAKVITGILAMNLAKTPIAASLSAAEFDLQDAQGRRVIVLLTDGEETCDGDPEKAIQALRDKGLDITLNIVGFAIDNEVLESQFESWAKTGNGRYFSARDQSGLSDSIELALQTPYSVYDPSGELAAKGVVGGEKVELEAGIYRLVVETSPQQVFEAVEILGEEDVMIQLEH